MTIRREENFEEALERALDMREAGKSAVEIFAAFPAHERDLREIFDMLEMISAHKDAVKPSDALIGRVFPSVVTRADGSRSMITKAGQKGRTVDNEKGKDNFINVLFPMNWKLFAPIAVVALVAVLVFSSKTATQPTEPAAPNAGENVALTGGEAVTPVEAIGGDENATAAAVLPVETPVVVAPATGNVDATVNAILTSATAEVSALDDVSADVAMLDLDSQAFNDFTQSYGEDQF